MKKIMFMFAMLIVAGALALPSVSSADSGHGNSGKNKGGGWTTSVIHDNKWGGWGGSYGNGSFNTTVSDARLQTLINELMRLQALLAQLQNGNNNGSDCSYERIGNSGNYRYVCDTDNDDVRSITVDFDDDAADVVVRYNDGDRDEFSIDADTREEAIDFIVEETDLSEATVRAHISFSGNNDDDNDDDVDTIKVTVDRDDNEATARVRYDDGDTETFDYDTDDKDDIISDIADDLDMDEDDVRDIATFTYTDSNNDSDDVESIDVEIDDSEDDATARVEFEDGTHTNYHFNTDDEDDIISDLADFLDLDEDEVEDLIDFDHV